MCLVTSCSWPYAIMVACEECSSPQVTGLRWYHWLELRSQWRRQQYSHFDTACQRPKGKLHFLFAVMMSVPHVISAICRTLFPPSAGDEYKNHPSRQGSIALPVPEVPKMSVGAICFTSTGSNGGCWVVLVFPRLFWGGGGMGFFFPYATYAKEKKVYATYTKKKFPSKKNATYAKKKVTRLTPKKKRLTLISTIEIRFPPTPSPSPRPNPTPTPTPDPSPNPNPDPSPNRSPSPNPRLGSETLLDSKMESNDVTKTTMSEILGDPVQPNQHGWHGRTSSLQRLGLGLE